MIQNHRSKTKICKFNQKFWKFIRKLKLLKLQYLFFSDCDSDEFSCDEFRCISKTRLCDGRFISSRDEQQFVKKNDFILTFLPLIGTHDCSDLTDEVNCPSIAHKPVQSRKLFQYFISFNLFTNISLKKLNLT